MITVRCSSLPIAAACAASQTTADGIVRIASNGAPAAAGSAVHHLLSRAIGHCEWADIEQASAMFGADPAEVGKLWHWAWKSWEAIRADFPAPETEIELTGEAHGCRLTGHVDLMSVAGDELRLGDWKSGRGQDDADEQLRGYAWLGLQQRPECQTAYVAVIRVRTMERDAKRYTRQALDSWIAGLSAALHAGAYNPGVPQCLYCPRRLGCTARQQMIADSITSMICDGADDLPQEAGKLYDRIKLLRDICDQASDSLRFVVADAGGTLDLKDGRELRLVSEERRHIDPRRGLPMLREAIGPDQLPDCLTIGLTKVREAIMAGAPRGEKGAAVTAFMEQLDADGALLRTTVEKLVARKKS